MTEKENKLMDQAKEGFFKDLLSNLHLIFSLMKDKRVNFALKLLPVGALVYLVVPYDLLPVNPVDDALVIWLGFSMFIELCPDDIVEEHRAKLKGEVVPTTDVVEGTFKDIS